MTMIFLCRSRFDDNLYDHLMRGFVSYTGVDLTLIKDCPHCISQRDFAGQEASPGERQRLCTTWYNS
ncbi:hypothetical protein DTO027B5_258 [Paecilomyces variotii]|nr:hypothetical protein DTO027B5_258 [Paecilomyces variotii]